MRRIVWLLFCREWRLAWRRPGDLLNPLVFFALVVSLFPLAVGPDPALLRTMAPGVIWVAALLATLCRWTACSAAIMTTARWNNGCCRRTRWS